MRRHHFPYRRNFEYDRHTIFLLELVNSLTRSLDNDDTDNIKQVMKECDEVIASTKALMRSDLQTNVIRKKMKGAY